MRMIGQFQSESQARTFSGFLSGRGIDNQADEARAGGWEVWVHDESRLDEATVCLHQFIQNPDDPMFAREAQIAAGQIQRQEAKESPRQTRVIDGRTVFYRPPVPHGFVTIALIAVCAVVFVITKGGDNTHAIQPFTITRFEETDNSIYWTRGLPEIRHGEIWRLFTPMLLHFGYLHIFFNLWWLWDLGNLIEARRGRLKLLIMVLLIAGISNFAQYTIGHAPNFGGMSGVVYGLLCYLWMQGRFNPASDLSLNPQIVTYMIIWFFLCLVGIIPGIANIVHAAGAIVGGVWGFLGARWATRHRR
jgi:GlpG protein